MHVRFRIADRLAVLISVAHRPRPPPRSVWANRAPTVLAIQRAVLARRQRYMAAMTTAVTFTACAASTRADREMCGCAVT